LKDLSEKSTQKNDDFKRNVIKTSGDKVIIHKNKVCGTLIYKFLVCYYLVEVAGIEPASKVKADCRLLQV
jgi:hypothetical protein